MKSLVISFPKSGTYLLSKILELMGLMPTHWHIGPDRYSDYSAADLGQARSNPRRFDVLSPMAQTIAKVPENTFSVSHLPYSNETLKALDGFKKIILTRNPYDCLCSQMMWEYSTERYLSRKKAFEWPKQKSLDERLAVFYQEVGQKYIKKYNKLLPWLELPDVLVLNYDLIIGEDEVTIQSILNFFEGELQLSAERISAAVRHAMSAKTLTKSEQRFQIMNHPEHLIFKDPDLLNIHLKISQHQSKRQSKP